MRTRILYSAVIVVVMTIVSLALEPPKIISASPQFWAIGVQPSQKTVSVTFDQPMRPGFWDFLGRDTLSPPSNLRTTMSADGKSYDLNVRLQPGKAYVMGLNERGIPGVGFQNQKGLSLRPTYLVFQTAGTPLPEDAPPRVLNTSPPNAAQDINPGAAKGIVVAFDKPMNNKKHGLRLWEDNKPMDLKTVNFAYSPDGKIFTLNFALKPSTHYEVEMNGVEDIGFAAATRVPLWPVHFAFTTGQSH